MAKKPTGPEPERLKIEGDWEAAVTKGLGKKRPPGGWPKPPAKGVKIERSKPDDAGGKPKKP